MNNNALSENSKHSTFVISKSLALLGRSALIYPVRFVGSTADVEFSPRLYAFNVLAVTLLTVSSWASLLNEVRLFWINQSTRFNNGPILVVALFHFTLVTAPCLIAVIGSASKRYKTLLDVEQVLISVDKVLDGTTADKRVEWFALYLVVHLALVFLLDFSMWMDINPTNKSFFLVYAFHYINFMSVAVYAQIAFCIGHRFDTINRQIEAKLKWLTAINCTEFVSRKYHDLTDLIQSSDRCHKDTKYIPFEQFQEFYWSLCHSIKLINEQYGWQLLMCLLQNVMNFVIAPNVIIVQIMHPEKWGPVNLKVTVNCFAWLLTHLLYLFLMVIPTSYAAIKAEKTACIICEHLNISFAKDDIAQLELFILQLQKFKLRFSICGVITLQRSTITTVIGTVITYLLISIQFLKSP
ncbi:uncharacterized protein LOC126843217 [Adelges cooleyi]|uniref:uncharacterized protein LOC126843217 n=1 Tax=Adelges cooleyi TaxID=133065 RepID=UPI00217F27C2|nr:uncharacterized protein LOC126843217 [Adelges cooleyi]